MFDVSTHIVSSHHETMAWCEDICEGLEYSVYRPHDSLIQSRNAHLHQVMHFRSHQQEF